MFKLLLSKTDSLKFKRKRNWDLLILYFSTSWSTSNSVENRTSHNLQCMSRLIYFSNQMNIRETMFGCHFVYLWLCVQFVCVSGFLCIRDCILQLVTRPEFSHVRIQPCRRHSSSFFWTTHWCGCMGWLLECDRRSPLIGPTQISPR